MDRIVAVLREHNLKITERASSPEDLSDEAAELLIYSREAGDAGGSAPSLGALVHLRRRFPTAKIVLVLPQDAEPRTMEAAVGTQVEGVVFSSHLETALEPTLRAVHAEQVVLPRGARRRVRLPALSHRERQVLRLAVLGRTNDEIAASLFLSVSTVKSHLSSAFSKLSVRSRSEAAALVLDPREPMSALILNDHDGEVALAMDSDR